MNKLRLVLAGALILGAATSAAAASNPVRAVSGHTVLTQIILEESFEEGRALSGLVGCPKGTVLQRMMRALQDLPTCGGAGYVYAFPSWAGNPWESSTMSVIENRLEIDPAGRAWSTVRLQYMPAGVAESPDAQAIVDAFAVQIQTPTPGADGSMSNYHLTIDAQALAVTPSGIAAYALGVGPSPQ